MSTVWDYSIVMVVDEAGRENANRLMKALGLDGAPLPGRSFSFRASDDGLEPADHFFYTGCCSAEQLSVFEDIAAADPAEPEDGWAAYGLTTATAAAAASSITVSFGSRSGEPGMESVPLGDEVVHRNTVLTGLSLVRIIP